jgi:uncharacterized membrane protein
MPDTVSSFTKFFSETLLVVVGVVLLIEGLRHRRVVPAFRSRASIALAAFVLLALISALLNRVPPLIAAAGLFYTLDAIAVFYLCRIVGFDRRQAALAIGGVVVVVAAMALVGVLQALFDPNLFGLQVVTGRSGDRGGRDIANRMERGAERGHLRSRTSVRGRARGVPVPPALATN